MPETNVTPIVEELAAIRRLLEHTLTVLQPRQKQTLADYPDLKALFETALARAGGDTRRVWCRAWHGFESRLVADRAVLVGGLHSSGFVSLGNVKEYDDSHLPYACQFGKARLLLAGPIQGTMGDWIEFLETIVNSKESLVIVTPEFETPVLLDTLVINKLRGTLDVCAVYPADSLTSIEKLAASLPTADGEPAPVLEAGQAPSKKLFKSLPIASIVARRDATVLAFEEIRNVPSAALDDVLWIDVGGNEPLDQRNRLVALAQAMVEKISRDTKTEVAT